MQKVVHPCIGLHIMEVNLPQICCWRGFKICQRVERISSILKIRTGWVPFIWPHYLVTLRLLKNYYFAGLIEAWKIWKA